MQMSSQPTTLQPKYPRTFHVVAKAHRLPLQPRLHLLLLPLQRDKREPYQRRFARKVRQYIASQEEGAVVFNWHGGEPALLGLDFFRKVIKLEHRIPAIGTVGVKPGNGLVTEWSVDPDDWGEFLCQTFDL